VKLFSGAIGGIALAGAMNLASGAAHSFFNAVGNASSAKSAKEKLDNLYRQKATYRTLRDGVLTCIVASFRNCVDYINHRNGTDYPP